MISDPNLYYNATCKVYILCYVNDLMTFGGKKAVADVVAPLQKELLFRVTGGLSEGQEASSDAECGEPPIPLRSSWKLRILIAPFTRTVIGPVTPTQDAPRRELLLTCWE